MSGVNRQVLYSCLKQDLSSLPFSDKKSPFEDVKAVASTLLLGSIFKKFEDPNPEADAKAIAKFLTVNRTAATWAIDTDLPSWDAELVGIFKKYLDNFLHPAGDLLIQSYDDLFQEGRNGPGSSLQGGGGDFYTKMFSSSLTVTSLDLYTMYRRSIANLPTWADAENTRLRAQGGPKIVSSNRTQCVPKNVDISRTICIEPTLNMWYQLGLGNVLRKRLMTAFGLNLSNVADVNRELARRGSISRSRKYSMSTIDLESASDSISLGMMNSMFPKWFMDIVMLLRSSDTLLPSGERVQLGMVSTMGNGFTFPLQTLIFSCVVLAVYKQMGIPIRRVNVRNPTWSVFGDDIIVVRKAYDRVAHLLTVLGFKINAEKSFYEGPFRESCGYDFYKGHFVRPVFFKKLDSLQDTYVAFNKILRWVMYMGINLPSTMQYLLRKCRFNPVPLWEADDAGLKVPLGFFEPKYKRNSGVYVYKAYVLKAARIKLNEDHFVVPRGQRRRLYNPSGILVAVTRGEFRGGELVTRKGHGRAVAVRRVALSWDIPPVSDLRGFLNVERLALSDASMFQETFGEAVWPIAGHVDGRRWKAVFESIR